MPDDTTKMKQAFNERILALKKEFPRLMSGDERIPAHTLETLLYIMFLTGSNYRLEALEKLLESVR